MSRSLGRKHPAPLRHVGRLGRAACFAAAAILTGCGPSQEDFHIEFATQYCALLFQCEDAAALAALGWTDEETCVADQSAVDTGETPYDRRAADECLSALADVTCADLDANTFPVVCAQVE